MLVPESTANADHIASVIGILETVALVENFGGGMVYLPKLSPHANGHLAAPTLDQVEQHTADGWSAKRIAKKYGCTVRAIHWKRARIRRRAEG